MFGHKFTRNNELGQNEAIRRCDMDFTVFVDQAS